MERVERWLAEEGSSRPMGLLRILIGLILLSRYAEWFAVFSWTQPLDAALAVGLYGGALALVFGVLSEPMALATGALQCWMILFSGEERLVHHHTWLLAMATLLLGFTPCGRSFSADRWWEIRDAERAGRTPPPERGPQWGVRLIAIQVAMLYFFATIDKLNPGFLTGERLEMVFAQVYTWSDPILHPGWLWTMRLMAWGTVVIETFLTFGFFFPRTRPWAIGLGVVLHGLFYTLLPVSTFSVTTVSLYLAFIDPDAFHRAVDRLLGAPWYSEQKG
jgi:hypothetical protein